MYAAPHAKDRTFHREAPASRISLAHSISGEATVKDSFELRWFARGGSRGKGQSHQLAPQGGGDYTGVIHCDRARMYWSFGRLQWCWAHLKRDIQGLIDSPCHTAR
jgi:hypothetical protein